MKTKDIIFYSLSVIFSLCIVLILFKVIPITLDKYSIILIFAIIGISLLPFMEKLKIGNLLELERLRDKIEEVKLNQYLGEVIKSNTGDIYYFDSDGRHKIPDEPTALFLRSKKGEVLVSNTDIQLMKTSYPIESVLTAKTVNWGGHIFIILNDKKFHVTSWSFMADWGKNKADEVIDDKMIKLIPTAR